MSAPIPPAGVLVTPSAQVKILYDCHRYLDAFASSAAFWTPATRIDDLSTDDVILAGRLASRLGGSRLSRWLLRTAFNRDPSNPRARYFARGLRCARWRMLDDLRAFERQPDLGGDDIEVRAAWLASYAHTWAALRDFERAYDCLDRARALAPDDSWCLSCESNVHGLADRRADALQAAERAWEIDPGAPFAAASLGNSLLSLGRVEECATRLAASAERSQSYELVADACWRQCALAETLEGSERQAVLEGADRLAARLMDVAPLADRDARTTIARIRLDIADLSNDYAGIEEWAAQVRAPFYRQVLANLRQNPGGHRIRLPFQRTIQSYDTCLPASLSAALSAVGVFVSADEIASAVTFGGTPEWAAADWLRARGFHVRFFAVTPHVAASLIEHGIAFVLNWDGEENGHSVAIVGLDQRASTLLVHDPQFPRDTQYLVDLLNGKFSPVGLRGLAAVPPNRAADLDELLPAEAEVVEAAQAHQRALTMHGPSAGRPIAARLAERFPAHAGTRYVQAVQALEDGHAGPALTGFQRLLAEFPEAPLVRVHVLAACRALANTSRLRHVLQNIVERGLLPGLQAEQAWLRPPDRYVFEYADLLRLSATTRDRAETLLHALLRRQPMSAGAWHVLADLLWHKRDTEGLLLCHRLASCLGGSDEHYARAYADALAAEKKDEEGLRWLEARVRAQGASPRAVSTWVSWVSALEDHGHPERALGACREALEARPGSPELLAFAVPFLARMGLWDQAEEQLRQLESSRCPAAFHEAAARFFQMRGEPTAAVDHAEAWVAELPHSADARRTLLDTIATRDQAQAAVARAALWTRQNTGHEGLEELYFAQLDRSASPRRTKYSVLLRRLRRNREDGWAWVNLTFECLQHYREAGDARRQRLRPRVDALLSECDRTCADSVPARRLHGLWFEVQEKWADAVDSLLECIDRDPETFQSYSDAWRCSARLPDAERRRVWARMQSRLVDAPGRLSIARDVMALLVERFGVAEAEKEIDTWRVARPDDPCVIEAAADLLIEHGHGRADARRALDMLAPAVDRYPHYPGLRGSLARAHRDVGELAEGERVLREIVRRHPDHPTAHIYLAWSRQADGDQEGAYRILDSALAASPCNAGLLDARVQILLANGSVDEARQVTEEGLARMPGDVYWRSRAIELLKQCRADEAAVAAAREGVALYPRGAYMWLLLGKVLWEMPRYAKTIREPESCLRRSLAFNAGLAESAEVLSLCLSQHERYEQAAQVLRDIEPHLADPSPAHGRLAWIERMQGEKAKALRDLAAAVKSAPWYAWGWLVICEWLAEDEAWEDARELLASGPAPMFANAAFRKRRLLVLQRAGLGQERLDAEWAALQRDLPDDPEVQAGRLTPLRASTSESVEAAAASPATSSEATFPWWVLGAAWLLMELLRNCS